MKTAELTGAALDWAVSKALGEYKPVAVPQYSTDWAQGGPIIEREKIRLTYAYGLQEWEAFKTMESNTMFDFDELGPTPLIAAMRCYVASKLGDEVEIPED
jgi:hypothetical protein